MPVYRLTPLSGTEDYPQWRASMMRPQCLWILARDEYEARDAVARATAVPSGAGALFSPWHDKAFVACEYDDDKRIARGIICVRRGSNPVLQRSAAAQAFGQVSQSF